MSRNRHACCAKHGSVSATRRHADATWRHRRGDSGLTIVELTVVLGLSGILAAALYTMTSGQVNTYSREMASTVMQDNIWGASQYLQTQIDRAGFGFGRCLDNTIHIGQSGSGQTLRAVTVHNACDLTSENPTTCAAATTTDKPDSFGIAAANLDINEVVSVRTTLASPASAELVYVKSPQYLVVGAKFVLWQTSSLKPCVMREVTTAPVASAPNGFEIAHAANSYNLAGGPAVAYPKDTLVIYMGTSPQTRYFSIYDPQAQVTGGISNPQLVTWQSNNTNPSADFTAGNYEVIAENIEDLQIAYACDINSDGVYEEGTTTTEMQSDEWAYNVAGDTIPDCDGNNASIELVRVTLIARSASADSRHSIGARPGAEDRAAGTSADDIITSSDTGTYYRRLITINVNPSNL